VLSLRGLGKDYGDRTAVQALDLDVVRGEILGLLGPNGAGKTTTISMACGVVTPTRGSVAIDGVDLAKQPYVAKAKLGLVPQDLAIFEELSALQNLRYFGALYGVRDVEWTLDVVGLRDRAKEPVKRFSGGMKRRLNIACGLVHKPELLVLDEPTAGLDPIVRREFIEAVIGAYQEGDPGRRTVFVSTHLIAEFEGLIDEFTIIEDGRAVLSSDADRARDRYQKVYARFAAPLRGTLDLGAARVLKQNGREIEVLAEGDAEHVVERLKTRSPEVVTTESLTLEEIFVAALQPARGSAALA